MTSSTSIAGQFRNRRGMVLTYRVQGAGPILVCHPGGPGFSADQLGNLAGIDRVRTLVLLNPRGTGASQRPPDPQGYEVDDYVNDVEDLRLHLGVESIELMGHSHGGIVAMDYAARYPRRVDRLLLVTTLARFAGVQREAMEAAMARRSDEPWYAEAAAAVAREEAGDYSSDEELGELWLKEALLYFASVGEVEKAYIESMRGGAVNADALRQFNKDIFETFDLRQELARVRAPTLVVVGEDDFITGPVAGAEIVEAIPGAELVTIPDAGHFVFVEAPDRFREAVVGFLAP